MFTEDHQMMVSVLFLLFSPLLLWFCMKASSHAARYGLCLLLGVLSLVAALRVGFHHGGALNEAMIFNYSIRPVGLMLQDIRDHYEHGNAAVAEAKLRYMADMWFDVELLPGKDDSRLISFEDFMMNIDAIER